MVGRKYSNYEEFHSSYSIHSRNFHRRFKVRSGSITLSNINSVYSISSFERPSEIHFVSGVSKQRSLWLFVSYVQKTIIEADQESRRVNLEVVLELCSYEFQTIVDQFGQPDIGRPICISHQCQVWTHTCH
ncbi:Reverse transcriptase and recombinase [Operophtera brumata]|uniref:Reverse transcriptase and recombinase n=1 Tax=Operophtera brumata TaxID=104452 RepID=A0A0L7LPN5_OPEBR|nr:Reverse transcriptase and recombinase [Operophtera brumata]